ncbi:MAG: CPXCG motif-containing cysteine-rich protein [Gemmatimonadales bacterium]|nr:MAG: CPXCG motif-containing cysteine-rich protein [Gemmatimonadales bacterium]
MDECLFLRCPYCGESVELHIDTGGGRRQEYVEDCPVCCRPWQVEARIENENSWHATLRTTDE